MGLLLVFRPALRFGRVLAFVAAVAGSGETASALPCRWARRSMGRAARGRGIRSARTFPRPSGADSRRPTKRPARVAAR